MRNIDHNPISRLMAAAIGKLNLTDSERVHNAECEACQDLLEIFRKELPGLPPTAIKESERKTPAA